MTRARDLASATPGSTGIPFRTAAGSVSASGGVTVTFPAGRFTVAPLVYASPNAVGANAFAQPITGNVTTSSFTIENLASNTGGVISFVTHWKAIQMTSGAASG